MQVSLRPSMKSLKIGSAAGRNKSTTPTSSLDHHHKHPNNLESEVNKIPGTTGRENPLLHPQPHPQILAQRSVIPRTRDDSSDEDDQTPNRPGPSLGMPSLLGHAPYHQFPGNYPPSQLPPSSSTHGMPGGGAIPPDHQYYAQMGGGGGQGLVGGAPPMPPHSMGGRGILPLQMPPPMVSFLDLVRGQSLALFPHEAEPWIHSTKPRLHFMWPH